MIRGTTVEGMLGELMGKANGQHHGVGGSMHFYDPAKSF